MIQPTDIAFIGEDKGVGTFIILWIHFVQLHMIMISNLFTNVYHNFIILNTNNLN